MTEEIWNRVKVSRVLVPLLRRIFFWRSYVQIRGHVYILRLPR